MFSNKNDNYTIETFFVYSAQYGLKSEQSKDDIYINEITNEVSSLEPLYKEMVEEFDKYPLTARYVSELGRFWDALNKCQTNAKKISEIAKEHHGTVTSLNIKVNALLESKRTEEKSSEKLTQRWGLDGKHSTYHGWVECLSYIKDKGHQTDKKKDLNRSLRMVDAAHTREQVAQETIENLRQQVARLHQELEQKQKASDMDNEYSTMSKSKEVQAKERERMLNEITNLKEKLTAALGFQEELERQNSAADLRIAELKQELENQTNEMSKESKFKERFEDDLQRVKKELAIKDAEAVTVGEQLADAQRKVVQHQNTIKEQKSTIDRLNQTIDSMTQRLVKLQDEYQKEISCVEDLQQTVALYQNQNSLKEEQINKLELKLKRTAQSQDVIKKKVDRLDVAKQQAEKERNKLSSEVVGLEKTVQDLKFQLENERRNFENAQRERELFAKTTQRTSEQNSESQRLLKLHIQARVALENEIYASKHEINKQAQQILTLEKDKDRLIAEAVIWQKKIDATEEDVKTNLNIIQDLKKSLDKLEVKYEAKQKEFENTKYEYCNCFKDLLQAQDDIADMKQKAKVMTLQIEQLKEDIAGKEILLIREQLAVRKVQAEKEAIRVEVQKYKDQLQEAKQSADKVNAELQNLHRLLRDAEVEQEKNRKTINQLINEKDILSTQMMRRNDEITLLRDKNKVLQSTLDKGETNYAQRMEDIRLLKLEVKKLNNEKTALKNTLNNMADYRTEVFHLEKDLTTERIKSKALEEELQNPLNMHRWRKLEGSDPSTYELVQKLQIQQKKILDYQAENIELQNKYNDLDSAYNKLKDVLSRQPVSDHTEKVVQIQRKMNNMEIRIKVLTAERDMREKQAADLRSKLGEMNQNLIDVKKKYFAQKKKEEQMKKKTLSQSQEPKLESQSLPSISTNKSKFVGGGYNMAAASVCSD